MDELKITIPETTIDIKCWCGHNQKIKIDWPFQDEKNRIPCNKCKRVFKIIIRVYPNSAILITCTQTNILKRMTNIFNTVFMYPIRQIKTRFTINKEEIDG